MGADAGGQHTRDRISTVPFPVCYFSPMMTLALGDLILTGTPEGLRDVLATK